jgi:hypothetical protein
VIETKGLKLLQNVETHWVSLIDPMRRLLAEYRSVLGKAYADRSEATVSFFSTVCRRIFCVSFVEFLFLYLFTSYHSVFTNVIDLCLLLWCAAGGGLLEPAY